MIFKKNLILYIILIFSFIFILFIYFIQNNLAKEKNSSLEPISINLLTSVHPNLVWEFKPVKKKNLS